jgi:hypothetical protein
VISCQKASLLQERELHEKLSAWEKFLLVTHRLVCRHCRNFQRQVLNIRRILRAPANRGREELSAAARERIREGIRGYQERQSDG